MTKIQELELEILKVAIDYFDKNNLKYFLCGGSLLGAVRHKGFIPWDDDIDVGMLREDYNKLIELAKKDSKINENIEICTHELGTANYPISKIANKKIKVLKAHSVDDKYLFVDIIPFDIMPATEEETVKICKKGKHYHKLVNLYNIDKDYLKEKEKNSFKRFLLGLFKKTINIDKVIKKSTRLGTSIKEKTGYSGCIVWGYGPGERIKDEDFDTEYFEFEGLRVKGLKGYDKYLKGLYKNYMELPPEDKRKYHEIKIEEIK